MKIDPKKITLTQSEIEEAIAIWLHSKIDNDKEEIGSMTHYSGHKTHGSPISDATINTTVIIKEKVKK